MQCKKCLVMLMNLDDFDSKKLNNTFGFGPECFEGGSKLLITSNKPPVTKCSPLCVEEVCSLTKEQGYELFYNILLEYQIDALNDDPVEWRSITKRLSGHPLSITMLARLLSMKGTKGEWDDVHRKLKGSGGLELKDIFEICCNDLPPYLLSCFLHLANFPQGMEIATKKLYQVWIAAGYFRHRDDEVEADAFLENLAESYLIELVRRGLVIDVKRGPTGKIRTCQLHFGLWELCEPSKARKPQSDQPTIHEHRCKEGQDCISDDGRGASSLTLTSYRSTSSFVYLADAMDLTVDVDWKWFIDICSEFKLLRILDLEGLDSSQEKLPKEIESLSDLRYLSLNRTWVTELPTSIEKLTSLQTLDLRVLKPMFIPDVLSKLKYLRHLYLPATINTPSLQLRGLGNLQTLFNLHSDKADLISVHELKLLRKISIRKMHAVKEVGDVLRSVGTSVDLSMDSEIVNTKPSTLSSLQFLHKLRIKGRISVPLSFQMFPEHLRLKELLLKHTKLEQDPLPVLEKLPELRRLCFDHASYLGEKMSVSHNCKVAHLRLRSLSGLKHLDGPEGGIQCLGSILITYCWRLDVQDVKTKFKKSRVMVEL